MTTTLHRYYHEGNAKISKFKSCKFIEHVDQREVLDLSLVSLKIDGIYSTVFSSISRTEKSIQKYTFILASYPF